MWKQYAIVCDVFVFTLRCLKHACLHCYLVGDAESYGSATDGVPATPDCYC
jgi:hypothetical protein